MAFEPSPVHELITSYAMELNRIYTQPETNMTKLIGVINASFDYAELIKANTEINYIDLVLWDAITQKYIKKL